MVFISNCRNRSASDAADVVMMMRKHIAQLNFVFPAHINAVHDTEFFKELNRTVKARTVYDTIKPLYQVVHCLWLLTPEQFTHKKPGLRSAIAVFFQDFRQ